jgi:hypothetical protein
LERKKKINYHVVEDTTALEHKKEFLGRNKGNSLKTIDCAIIVRIEGTSLDCLESSIPKPRSMLKPLLVILIYMGVTKFTVRQTMIKKRTKE